MKILPFTGQSKFCKFVILYQSTLAIFCYYFFCPLSDPVKQDPILDQFSTITRPYPRVNGLQTIPFPVVHTRIANIWEYPPLDSGLISSLEHGVNEATVQKPQTDTIHHDHIITFHMFGLASLTSQFLNGTHNFSELVLAGMALFMDLSRSSRPKCGNLENCGGKSVHAP